MSASSQVLAIHSDTERGSRDYSGHLARLLVLGASFGAGWVLNHVGAGRPYFGFLVLIGVILVCIGLVLGPSSQRASTRLAVPLFDLAWIMFAMYLTDGLGSFLLPLLYVFVATAALRGNRWELGTCLAGAITGIFILAGTHATGPQLSLAVSQAALLAAGALAVRLTASASQVAAPSDASEALYEQLLGTVSDAVVTLQPQNWTVLDANAAARELFGSARDEDLIGQPLDRAVTFHDHAFPTVCRQRLARSEEVCDTVTYATTRDGRELVLRFNFLPARGASGVTAVQAVIEATEEPQAVTRTTPLRDDDFSVNYIPSLTHELNNHLAAIRLSAELAATTGKIPDFDEIQQQVDHCQEVLQTVVLQILRSSAPVQSPDETPGSDLRTVIERCLLLTRPQVLTSGIELQVSVPAELPEVVGFAHELQEAIIRVMIYSIKVMSKQDPPRVLGLLVSPHEHEVEVLITDSSTGLNSRQTAILNGRYAAVARAEDRTWDIVRDGVCRFGGQVQAANGLNGGMRLKIDLPIVAQQVVASA